MSECTCPADKMPFGRCCKAPTSADVIAGLEMALAQAAAMIERQQHVMQRAMVALEKDERIIRVMAKAANQSHIFRLASESGEARG